MLHQPEHDPFAPHVELDPRDDRDVAALPSETRPLVESPIPVLPGPATITALDEHGQPVEPEEVGGAPAVGTALPESVSEDDDLTPPPGPGKRTRRKQGAPARSKARASKLAEELDGE